MSNTDEQKLPQGGTDVMLMLQQQNHAGATQMSQGAGATQNTQANTGAGGSSGGDVESPQQSGTGTNSKKRAGRRKINIEFIQDKSRRHITFSKRKAGIMKKAYELSTLTGTQVLLLVASETGHVYTFATPKLQPLITQTEGKNLIQQCLNAPEASQQQMMNGGGDEDEEGDEEEEDYPQGGMMQGGMMQAGVPQQQMMGQGMPQNQMMGQQGGMMHQGMAQNQMMGQGASQQQGGGQVPQQQYYNQQQGGGMPQQRGMNQPANNGMGHFQVSMSNQSQNQPPHQGHYQF